MPHLDTVYRMAHRLSGRPDEADDLVQETFLRAYRAYDRFELRDHGARPWLLRILHNVFFTRRGREKRQPMVVPELSLEEFVEDADRANLSDLPSGEVNWDLFDQELKTAVGTLSPDLREVLLLWSLEGLSYKEMAEVCDCPLGTIMSRLYRARQQVGSRLGDYARSRGLSVERSGS